MYIGLYINDAFQLLKAEHVYAVFQASMQEAIVVKRSSMSRPFLKTLGPPVKQELAALREMKRFCFYLWRMF